MGPTKPITVQPGKKPAAAGASKDEGDADDPIARSLAERTKAGSISAVVGAKTTAAPTKPQVKPPAIEKKPVPAAASKIEGDTEDPISKSLAERTKAGSISEVVATKPTKPQPKPPATEKKQPVAASEAKKPEDAKKPEKPSDKKPADEEKKKPTAAKASEETKVKPKDDKKPAEKPGEKKDDKKSEIKVTSTRPVEEKKSEPKKLVG